MTLDAETLRSRIKTPAVRGRRKVFRLPEPEDFRPGTVLAFDQTLTKTGWVLLSNGPLGLEIVAGGLLRPIVDPTLTSFTETLAKAVSMQHQYVITLSWHCLAGGNPDYRPEAIVHEMPAVMGYRTESSLGAAIALHIAAENLDLLDRVHMLSKQRAYGHLVGVYPTEKKYVTTAVNRLIPKDRRWTSAWNQDVHDAALLGLDHLYTGANR